MNQVRRKVTIQKTIFMMIKTGFKVFSQVPHEYAVRRLQRKSRDREYFQTDKWERQSTSG